MISKKLLPHKLKVLVNEYNWSKVTKGKSGAKVFHLTCKGKPSLYLKQATIDPFLDLEKEANVLDWLKDKLPVPQKQLYVTHGKKEYLLINEISGSNVFDMINKHNAEELIYLLAKGLKTIHEIAIADCPFLHTIDIKIKVVKDRIANNLVDESDFDAQRQGATVLELFGELIKNKPVSEELVFAHGDYCLPNIIIKDGSISGFIDLSRAGISDKYRDLALAARSIVGDFGMQWLEPFFAFYGISKINFEKIDYYQLLDEFF